MMLSGQLMRGALTAAVAIVVVISLLGAPQLGFDTAAGLGLVLVAVAAVIAPGSAMPLVFLSAAVLYRIAATGPNVDLALAALVAFVPLVHQLSAITALAPLRSRIPAAALRPATRRYLMAVLPVETALLIVTLVF